MLNLQMLQNYREQKVKFQVENENEMQGNQVKVEIREENQPKRNFHLKSIETLQRIKPVAKKSHSFTQEEIMIFVEKFPEYRSKWTLYTRVLQKTEKEVKNLFYNSLRKLATRLANSEKMRKQFQKNKIRAIVLHHLINMSFTVRESFQKMQMSVDQLLIYKIKDKIFQFCFLRPDVQEEDILDLSKNIRKLKFGLKNLKIGKCIQNQKKALRLAQAMLSKELQQGSIKANDQVKNMPTVVNTNEKGQDEAENIQNDFASYYSHLNFYYGYLNYHFYPMVPIHYPVSQAEFQNEIKIEDKAAQENALKNETGF